MSDKTNKTYRDLKVWIKEDAKSIRELKEETKGKQRSAGDASLIQSRLIGRRLKHRHYHVAYSEMRGRTRDQIESGLREETLPLYENLIAKIKKDYSAEIPEVAEYEKAS